MEITQALNYFVIHPLAMDVLMHTPKTQLLGRSDVLN